MLGDRTCVAARLVEHDHPGLGAGLYINGVETRAIAGRNQQVRCAAEQTGIHMEPDRQLIARCADLIGVRGLNDARSRRVRRIVLKPVERHIRPYAQRFGEHRMGEIAHIKHALGIDRHSPSR